jgi:nucleoside-diphosphate-sugar epimerase
MRIGITGAAGFIGKALAARAQRAGHQIVGLDRLEHARALYERMGAEYLVGEVTDVGLLRRFCRGLDRIYHTAAIVKEDGEWSEFFRVNVLGADSVGLIAREAGVRELVHFSSVMVYGFDFPDNVSEEGPLDPADNPYCTTKILSEESVLRHHDPGRFDVYVIRPGDVYGPGSVPWTVRPVEMMRKGQWVYIDSRRSIFNHVFIDNLLDGIDLILSRRASGAPFAITDDARTTAREFFSHYQRLLGVGFIPELPRALAEPIGALAGGVLRTLGRPPELNRQAVRYMTRRYAYGIGKIKALGYRPAVGLAEGMERCAAWLKAEGLAP